MSVYSLKTTRPRGLAYGQTEAGGGIPWMLAGGGVLAAVGVVLAGIGVVKKKPLPAVAGVALTGGGGYAVYSELTAPPEIPPPPPGAGYEIIEDIYGNPAGWAGWYPT